MNPFVIEYSAGNMQIINLDKVLTVLFCETLDRMERITIRYET